MVLCLIEFVLFFKNSKFTARKAVSATAFFYRVGKSKKRNRVEPKKLLSGFVRNIKDPNYYMINANNLSGLMKFLRIHCLYMNCFELLFFCICKYWNKDISLVSLL